MIEQNNTFINADGTPKHEAFFPHHVFMILDRMCALSWRSDAKMWQSSPDKTLYVPADIAENSNIKWLCPIVADSTMMRTMWAVMHERFRQMLAEGFMASHDDTHKGGELALGAACYALHNVPMAGSTMLAQIGCACGSIWPFEQEWWKPTNAERDLTKSCAMLLAEVDRLKRAQEQEEPSGC